MARRAVLIVDDSAAVGRMVQQVLDRAGFDARWVAEAGEALVLLDEWVPDVVLVDLRLGDGDGLTLARRIRRRAAGARIIGLSGDAPPTAASRTLDAFLLKPVGFAELLAAVGR